MPVLKKRFTMVPCEVIENRFWIRLRSYHLHSLGTFKGSTALRRQRLSRRMNDASTYMHFDDLEWGMPSAQYRQTVAREILISDIDTEGTVHFLGEFTDI